jgi:hypothetical protein
MKELTLQASEVAGGAWMSLAAARQQAGGDSLSRAVQTAAPRGHGRRCLSMCGTGTDCGELPPPPLR